MKKLKKQLILFANEWLRTSEHTDKSSIGRRSIVQTPLMIGVPLVIHGIVRSRRIVENIRELYIGGEYQMILDIEKRLEQAVLERIVESGKYFCLPDFVKKDVDIVVCLDNINALEDTPTGQNTLKL